MVNHSLESKLPSHHNKTQEQPYCGGQSISTGLQKLKEIISQSTNSNTKCTQQISLQQKNKKSDLNGRNNTSGSENHPSIQTLKQKSLFMRSQVRKGESVQHNTTNSKVQKGKVSVVSTATSSLNPLLSYNQMPLLHQDLQLQVREQSGNEQNDNLNYIYALQSVKDFECKVSPQTKYYEQTEEKELEQQIQQILQSAKKRLNITDNQLSYQKTRKFESFQANFPQQPFESKWVHEMTAKAQPKQIDSEIKIKLNLSTEQQENIKNTKRIKSERGQKSLQGRTIGYQVRNQQSNNQSISYTQPTVITSRNCLTQKSLTTSLVYNPKILSTNQSKLRQKQVMSMIKKNMSIPAQKKQNSSEHCKKKSIYNSKFNPTVENKQ